MLSYHATAAGKEGEGEGGGILPVCRVLWPAAMLSYHATAAGKEGEGEGGRGRDILPLACNHIHKKRGKEGVSCQYAGSSGLQPRCLTMQQPQGKKEGEGGGDISIYLATIL